ncbi:hypothetical protein ACPWR0_09380 [Pandoraea pneumonica]|uniref:hypothetical protein n=1 Tax=Pandoraea pneumonica TaxID=2508299 RepID=UPI003CE8B480
MMKRTPRRAEPAALRYGLPAQLPKREPSFATALRAARQTTVKRNTARHTGRIEPHTANQPSPSPSMQPSIQPAIHTSSCRWPIALTLLFVANLAVSLPSTRARRPLDTGEDDATASGIQIRPLTSAPLKTDYSASDVLKALASGGAPFTNFAASVGEAYAVATGNDIAAKTREQLRESMRVLDYATSLIPGVQLLRVPGDVAKLMSDELAGKTPHVGRIASVLWNSDLRGIDVPSEPHRSTIESAPVETIAHIEPVESVESVKWRPVVKSRPRLRTDADTAEPIQGEREFLKGYSQSLLRTAPLTQLRHGLVLRGGRFFLHGTDGYYRVQRAKTGDHWYVDAPRPGKPQVPLRLDPATGQWYAYAPLRLCGGGCSQSRLGTPHSATDSIGGYVLNLVGIADTRVRDAIQEAFDTLGELRLLRSNRQDLRMFRDNSITDIREVLETGLREIDPTAPLSKQQRRAAEMTAMYYLERPGLEAFCHENAEILLHFMLVRGVPKSRLRMVTLRPQNRPAHVMLLYSESPVLIKMLEMSTPQPPVEGLVDGLTHLEFARAILSSRYRSRLFDPWSRIKMVTFERARSEREVSDMLAPTLEDAGYRRGEPYRISVTRPLGKPPQRQAAQPARDRL